MSQTSMPPSDFPMKKTAIINILKNELKDKKH